MYNSSMPIAIDISGQVFGRLKADVCVGRTAKREALWRCWCACGKVTVVRLANLRDGHTQSCGCARKGSGCL